MNVRVASAVTSKQIAFELRGILHRLRVLVALPSILRQSEVAYRVDGVVVAPDTNRAARKTRLEIIARFKHRVQGHVAAVTPSPNPDAIRIDVRKRLEIAHAVALVGKLLRAHAEMQRRLESMSAPCRAPIVEGKNNVALLH